MPAVSQKNRRYRNAKISEYKLRRVVECFAQNMTAKDAALATKLSAETVSAIYLRLRERLADHGIINRRNLVRAPGSEPPDLGKHIADHRGVKAAHHELHEFEIINRIMAVQQFSGFEELSAANPAHVKRAIKLHNLKQNGIRRYSIIEKMALKPGQAEPDIRPFASFDFEKTSTLLVNEKKLDPQTAFFRFLWKMILNHPL